MVMHRRSPHRTPHSGLRAPGFTLIELLVVISVIAILSGLLVVIIPAVQRMAKRARTGSIMAVVAQAIESAAARSGRSPSTVAHPLAGSATPRLRFVRIESDGSSTILDSTALALRCTRSDAIPDALCTRLLLDRDRFADPALPLLFGVERGAARILGVACSLSERYAEVPDPGPGHAWTAAQIDDPVTQRPWLREHVLQRWISGGFTREVDSGHDAWERAGDRLMGLVLADQATELAQLGALVRSQMEGDPTDAAAVTRDDETRLLLGKRVRDPTGTTSTAWEPGLVQVDGVWRHYRLRGPALYDAWGRELLASVGDGGRLHLTSAGQDGVFAIDPGSDGIYQSAAGGPLLGDDRDGSSDNVRQAKE